VPRLGPGGPASLPRFGYFPGLVTEHGAVDLRGAYMSPDVPNAADLEFADPRHRMTLLGCNGWGRICAARCLEVQL